MCNRNWERSNLYSLYPMWIVGTGYQGARVLYPMWDICILHVGYAHTYYTPCEVHTYIVNTLVLILSMPGFIYVHDTPIRVHPSLNIVLNSNRQDQIVCSAKNAHYIQCVWMQWVPSAPLPRIQSLHPQWVLIVPTTSPPGTHNVQATVLGKSKTSASLRHHHRHKRRHGDYTNIISLDKINSSRICANFCG